MDSAPRLSHGVGPSTNNKSIQEGGGTTGQVDDCMALSPPLAAMKEQTPTGILVSYDFSRASMAMSRDREGHFFFLRKGGLSWQSFLERLITELETFKTKA